MAGLQDLPLALEVIGVQGGPRSLFITNFVVSAVFMSVCHEDGRQLPREGIRPRGTFTSSKIPFPASSRARFDSQT